MPAKQYRVSLTQDEREHLLDLTRRGKSSVRRVKRSLILCKADEGLSDKQVSEALLVSPSTVSRVRRRFAEEGMESALTERPRPGQRRKLDGKQEAHLVAVACSQAPEGHTHWTLQLLANKVVQLKFSDSISLETVRQVLTIGASFGYDIRTRQHDFEPDCVPVVSGLSTGRS
jgi:transposase